MIDNTTIIVVLAVVISLAIFCIVKAKKSGKKCVGCPNSSCPSRNANDTGKNYRSSRNEKQYDKE